MITINLISPNSYFTEYLFPRFIGRKSLSPVYDYRTNLNKSFNSGNYPLGCPSLSPELRDQLMGKAPLRLVAKREEFGGFKPGTTWLETLECGHEQIHYLDWEWKDMSYLVQRPPSAKRRRCTDCKALLASKKPPQSVRLPQNKKEVA